MVWRKREVLDWQEKHAGIEGSGETVCSAAIKGMAMVLLLLLAGKECEERSFCVFLLLSFL